MYMSTLVNSNFSDMPKVFLLHLIQTTYLSMSGFKQSTLIISNICLDLRQNCLQKIAFITDIQQEIELCYKTEQNNPWLEMPLFSYKMSKTKFLQIAVNNIHQLLG